MLAQIARNRGDLCLELPELALATCVRALTALKLARVTGLAGVKAIGRRVSALGTQGALLVRSIEVLASGALAASGCADDRR